MHHNPTTEQFWNEAVQSCPELAGKHYYEAFYFGNTESAANRLADLVLEGEKTATSSLLWTLGWWKEHIWDYYVQECAAIGRQATEDMPILCERLRVVYP